MNQPRIKLIEQIQEKVKSVIQDLNYNEPGYIPQYGEDIRKLSEALEELLDALLHNRI